MSGPAGSRVAERAPAVATCSLRAAAPCAHASGGVIGLDRHGARCVSGACVRVSRLPPQPCPPPGGLCRRIVPSASTRTCAPLDCARARSERAVRGECRSAPLTPCAVSGSKYLWENAGWNEMYMNRRTTRLRWAQPRASGWKRSVWLWGTGLGTTHRVTF